MAKQRQSSINRLPPDILEKLQDLLRDPRVTQLDATAKINEILTEEGHQDLLSKSAVNRYAVRMEDVGKKIRQSREVAQMWIAKLGAEPAGKVGNLLNEMVRTLAFDAMLDFSEGNETASPKMIKDLAVAVHRLERAATENVKVAEEIRKQERTRAAAQAVSAAKKGGLSSDAVQAIRREILGVAA